MAKTVKIGDRIKQLLWERGITTLKFEADTGMSRRLFYHRTGVVRRSILMACAYYLGITVEEMVEGTDAFEYWYPWEDE